MVQLPLSYYYFRGKYSWILSLIGPYYFFRVSLPGRNSFNLKSSIKIIRLFLVKSIRFSFSGKGYRLYLDSNAFSFTFGHSHLFYIYFFRSPLYLTAKTKGFLLGLNFFNLKNLSHSLLNSKPLNIFTWRGVKLKTRWSPKKSGKISMYR